MPITIDKPSKYFNTLLWTGDGTNNRSITGVGFRPELAWTKRRDSAQGNTNHNIWDFVRGAGNNSELSSNSGVAEGASGASEYGYISALNSDGFTLTDGTDATYKNLYTNNSGGTYVSWNWLANGTGVSNTDGTITSTVSANTTSGFSIVTYTGNSSSSATVGHGLGVAPSMILNKCRAGANAAQTFFIYHKGLSANNMIAFNTNAQAGTGTYSSGILSTSPTSTTFGFTAGSGGVINVNESSSTYVSYCFADVKGFSKAFSYTGNGSSDGNFVYCGFRPAFVLIKCTSNATDWFINDNKRLGYNGGNNVLYPDLSSAEATSPQVDILSNGFKTRTVDSMINNSGYTYVGFAFAEQPFVSSKGIVANAR